ncbi:MAG: PD40 domain-containing protein, partial [Armatimonadetes bacterium]|nr:PD40 domain-containing protein [Armatimonadota bacterium]
MRQTVAVCLVVTLVVLIGGCGGTGTVLAPNNIAFETDRDGNREIYVMEADGSNQTNLTNNSAYDEQPAWSPNGSQIAFGSHRDDNWEVYVMDSDGSNPTNLTNNSAYDDEPAWSPDGSQIAFHSDRDGNGEVYVM